MAVRQPRYSEEEFAKRGDALYESEVRAQVEEGNYGNIVAIDIETGAFEVDQSKIAACDRLEANHPEARIWTVRVGSRHARQFGGRTKRAVWSPEQIIQLSLSRSDRKVYRQDAIVDTGFNGWLPLSPDLIAHLDLKWKRRESECVFNVDEAVLVWDGNFPTIPIDESGSEQLVGMSLMEGYQLIVQVFKGGHVELSRVHGLTIQMQADGWKPL